MTSLQVKYAPTSAVFFHNNIDLSGCFSETGREDAQFAMAPSWAPFSSVVSWCTPRS